MKTFVQDHNHDLTLSAFTNVMASYRNINEGDKAHIHNGDESTKEAIKTKFPNATHRLCTWHLAEIAVLNIKDNNFCAAFKTAVYGHFEVEKFDQYWTDMVAAFGAGGTHQPDFDTMQQHHEFGNSGLPKQHHPLATSTIASGQGSSATTPYLTLPVSLECAHMAVRMTPS
ncbi:hypothetical protein AHAS_Ahas17G0166800 [Arachis hypogaea]